MDVLGEGNGQILTVDFSGSAQKEQVPDTKRTIVFNRLDYLGIIQFVFFVEQDGCNNIGETIKLASKIIEELNSEIGADTPKFSLSSSTNVGLVPTCIEICNAIIETDRDSNAFFMGNRLPIEDFDRIVEKTIKTYKHDSKSPEYFCQEMDDGMEFIKRAKVATQNTIIRCGGPVPVTSNATVNSLTPLKNELA